VLCKGSLKTDGSKNSKGEREREKGVIVVNLKLTKDCGQQLGLCDPMCTGRAKQDDETIKCPTHTRRDSGDTSKAIRTQRTV